MVPSSLPIAGNFTGTFAASGLREPSLPGPTEVAAAEAATAMVDYAEYYTRSVIVGRTTI
jgi:hypothetical protein